MECYEIFYPQVCARHTPRDHLHMDLADLQVAVANLAVQVDNMQLKYVLGISKCAVRVSRMSR